MQFRVCKYIILDINHKSPSLHPRKRKGKTLVDPSLLHFCNGNMVLFQMLTKYWRNVLP